MNESRMTLTEARARMRKLQRPNPRPGMLARIIGWLTADQPKGPARKRVYLPTLVQGTREAWEPPQRRKGKRK